MENTKIIYLDIDGVMNRPQNKLSKKHEGLEWDNGAIGKLLYMIKEGYRIVIISSIRENKSLRYLRGIFKENGISEENVIGKIDDGDKEEGIKKDIEERSKALGVYKYIIIDDIKIGRYYEKGVQIKPKSREGLKGVSKEEIDKYIQKKN